MGRALGWSQDTWFSSRSSATALSLSAPCLHSHCTLSFPCTLSSFTLGGLWNREHLALCVGQRPTPRGPGHGWGLHSARHDVALISPSGCFHTTTKPSGLSLTAAGTRLALTEEGNQPFASRVQLLTRLRRVAGANGPHLPAEAASGAGHAGNAAPAARTPTRGRRPRPSPGWSRQGPGRSGARPARAPHRRPAAAGDPARGSRALPAVI